MSVRQPLVTTGVGYFPTGYLPIGALPMGSLPMGALPTGATGGGGSLRGMSAAVAALSMAKDATVAKIIFIMLIPFVSPGDPGCPLVAPPQVKAASTA